MPGEKSKLLPQQIMLEADTVLAKKSVCAVKTLLIPITVVSKAPVHYWSKFFIMKNVTWLVLVAILNFVVVDYRRPMYRRYTILSSQYAYFLNASLDTEI